MTVIAISCNYAWASLGISKECEVLLIKKWNVWVQPELRRKIYEPLPMRGRHSQWGPAHTTDISHCKIKLDSNFWIMFFFTFRVKGVPVAEMPFSFPDITDHFLTQWEDGTGMQLATRHCLQAFVSFLLCTKYLAFAYFWPRPLEKYPWNRLPLPKSSCNLGIGFHSELICLGETFFVLAQAEYLSNLGMTNEVVTKHYIILPGNGSSIDLVMD